MSTTSHIFDTFRVTCAIVSGLSTEDTCIQHMQLFKDMLACVGLLVNHAKDEFGQTIKLLGVVVSSIANNGNAVSLSITNDRRAYVDSQCATMSTRTGPVSISELMAFGGLLAFCSQVIPGSRTYLHNLFRLIGSRQKYAMVNLNKPFREDCIWWRRLVSGSGPCGMLLDRQSPAPFFVTWDASSLWGIGGFFTLTEEFFSIPWTSLTLRKKRKGGQRGDNEVDSLCLRLAPRRNTPEFHINIMELYACFVALHRWGKHMRGYNIICYTDSSSVFSWLHKLTGPSEAIPLIRNIHVILVKHDIVLLPELIPSRENAMADALSRGDEKEFRSKFIRWKFNTTCPAY
jgi:hypothetical protein